MHNWKKESSICEQEVKVSTCFYIMWVLTHNSQQNHKIHKTKLVTYRLGKKPRAGLAQPSL